MSYIVPRELLSKTDLPFSYWSQITGSSFWRNVTFAFTFDRIFKLLWLQTNQAKDTLGFIYVMGHCPVSMFLNSGGFWTELEISVVMASV